MTPQASGARPGAAALPSPGSGQLESYLTEVTARLPGPPRARADIVAELRASLLDAADAHRTAGMDPDAAAEAAISEFGEPRLIGDAFRPELAARTARRASLTLLATGPLIGLLWAAAAHASHIGIRHAPPWQWAAPPGSLVAFPLAAAACAVTVWAALFTVAATGRLTRWLPARPRLAPVTAAIAGSGTVAVDAIILALLISQLLSAPRTLAPVPITAAATASLIRLTLARRAARRCLTSATPT